MLNKFFSDLFTYTKKVPKQRNFEWEKFQKLSRDQFLRLKEIGLSIPVVTI